MLNVSGDAEPSGNSLNRAVSAYQPIVHFEGSVREPVGPRDLDYNHGVDAKK